MAFKAEDGRQSKGGDFMMLQAPFPKRTSRGLWTGQHGPATLQPGKRTQPHL